MIGSCDPYDDLRDKFRRLAGTALTIADHSGMVERGSSLEMLRWRFRCANPAVLPARSDNTLQIALTDRWAGA